MDLIHHFDEGLIVSLSITTDTDGLAVSSAVSGKFGGGDDALHFLAEFIEGVGLTADGNLSLFGDIDHDFVRDASGLDALGGGGDGDAGVLFLLGDLIGHEEKDEEEEDDIDHRRELEAGRWRAIIADAHGLGGLGSEVREVAIGLAGFLEPLFLAGNFAADEGEDVGAGGFEFGDVVFNAASEEGIEGHGDDADDESGSGGDEGFPDSFGELELLGALDLAIGDFHERFDHSDDGSEEADHGGDASDVGEVADALAEDAGLAGAFGLGDFADFLLVRGGVFGEEVEGLLGDAGDGFAATVGIGDEAEVVALANHGLGIVHELIGNHGASSQGEEVEEDEHGGDDREDAEGDHDPAAFAEDVSEGEFFGRSGCGLDSLREGHR